MEYKKNPKSDLKRWSGTLFNLGLAASLGVVLVAFEWKAKDQRIIKTFDGMNDDWETIDIPITLQTPLPPPPQVPIEIITKPNDIVIDDISHLTLDINTTKETINSEVGISAPLMIEDIDKIENFVDVQAMFKGGMDAWYVYLNKNLKYPSEANIMGIEGMVIVRFVVNTDGSIQDRNGMNDRWWMR